jgi:uncharacterized lipoprotein YehR (DUF1307 family)
MGTKIQFVVTITTKDEVEVTRQLKQEFTQNILDGLVDKVNYSESIAVRPLELNFGMYEKKTEITHNF